MPCSEIGTSRVMLSLPARSTVISAVVLAKFAIIGFAVAKSGVWLSFMAMILSPAILLGVFKILDNFMRQIMELPAVDKICLVDGLLVSGPI